MKLSDLQGEVKIVNAGASSPTSSTPQRSAFSNFATGVAKGELSTLKGLGTIGQTVLDQTAGRVVNAVQGKGFVPTTTDGSVSDMYRPGSVIGKKVSDILKPQGTAENIGFGAEQTLEFLVPAFKVAKAERAINVLSQGIKSPLGAAAYRLVVKGGVSAGATTAVRYAQTGGDAKDAVLTGAISGGARVAFGIVGEMARALRVPERVYQIFFKNSKNDMLDEFTSDGLAAMQKNNPKAYQGLLDAGIIKVTSGGAPTVNETLAEQALHRGFAGSIRNMANEAVGKKFETEAAVQAIVKSYKGTINVSEPQYTRILQKIAQEYEDVGFNEISNRANGLIQTIKQGNGKVSAEAALDFRRLLYSAIRASSFEKPVSSLALTQANLRVLASELKNRLNFIPGMGQRMNDYAFYIDAMESLAKEAARRGNAQVVSLIDGILLGGGIVSGNPIAGLLTATARTLTKNAPILTAGAQAIQRAAISPATSAGIGAGSSAIGQVIGSENTTQ